MNGFFTLLKDKIDYYHLRHCCHAPKINTRPLICDLEVKIVPDTGYFLLLDDTLVENADEVVREFPLYLMRSIV